jgi:hypothetical protein
MALIDQIINISITRSTIGLTRSEFGTILIMGQSVVLSTSTFTEGEIKEYTSLSEVAEDFATDTGEYERAQLIFAQDIKVDAILIARKESFDADYTSMYSRIKNINNNFYAVMAIRPEQADLLSLARAIESDSKILAASGGYIDAQASELAALNSANLSRTFVINTKEIDGTRQPLEAAWLGRMLPTEPGTSTWAYKNLKSVVASEYSSSDITTLESGNANYYTKLGGLDNTLNGIMVNGEYIDIIRGLDWLDNFMKTSLLTLFQTNPKIPYTNNGIGLIENIVRASLDEAVSNNVINDDYIVTTPDSASVSLSDKATRTLRNVKFTATLTGAIQRVVINGNISV